MTDQEFFSHLKQSGIHLNPDQITAVRTIYGPVSVFAGPGSGKTTVLVCRLAYMYLVCDIPLSACLVMTFTRAAAQEMKERLLGFPGITEQVAARVTVGTFHSVFYRFLLREQRQLPAILRGHEQVQFIKEAIRTIEEEITDERVKQISTQIGLCKSYIIRPEALNVKEKRNIRFKQIFAMYEALKLQKNKMDYDDILLYTNDWLMHDHHARQTICQRYPFLIVDEFQDTNFVQYRILQLLAMQKNLFVVGDDDQAIYGFRGADVKFLLQFENDFSHAKQIVLRTNYRSTDTLVAFTSQLIDHNKMRQAKQFEGTGRTGDKPQILIPASLKDEADKIVQLIKQRMDEGVPANQCAVLYRTHLQARSVIDACIRSNLSFYIYDDDGNFYDVWYIRNVLQYLQLALNPNDLDSLFDIFNRPKRYVYGAQIRTEIIRLCKQSKKNAVAILSELRSLEPYQIKKLITLQDDLRSLRSMTPKSAVQFILQTIGYRKYVQEYADQAGMEVMEIIAELDELTETAAAFQTLEEFLVHITDVRKKIAESAGNRNVGIQFMTFHRAKGLEFEDVYILGAVEGTTPHSKAFELVSGNGKSRVKNKIPSSKQTEKLEQAMEEERRLFYVACTRAKSRLIVSAPQHYLGQKATPSCFIRELTEDGLEKKKTTFKKTLAKRLNT